MSPWVSKSAVQLFLFLVSSVARIPGMVLVASTCQAMSVLLNKIKGRRCLWVVYDCPYALLKWDVPGMDWPVQSSTLGDCA